MVPQSSRCPVASSQRLISFFCVVLVGTVFGACSKEEGRVLRSDGRIRYVAHGTAFAEPSEIDEVLLQLEEISDLFGVPTPYIEYHLYPSASAISDYTDVCTNGGEGRAVDCYDDGTIHAGRPVQTHELVHAAVDAWGGTKITLDEGLATLLVPKYAYRPEFESVGAARAGLSIADVLAASWKAQRDEVGGDEAYQRAADITRFLVDSLGWEEFLGFANMAKTMPDSQAMQLLLQSQLGEDAEDLVEAFAAFPRYPSQIRWYALRSTWRELVRDEQVELGNDLVMSFVHQEGTVSVVEVEGASSDLYFEDAGKVHVSSLNSLTPTGLVIRGRAGRYFLEGPSEATLRVFSEEKALNYNRMFIVGGGSVCVGEGTFRMLGVQELAEGVLLTDYPRTVDVCRAQGCETVQLWNAFGPTSFETIGETCFTPSEDFPIADPETGEPAGGRTGELTRYELLRLD